MNPFEHQSEYQDILALIQSSKDKQRIAKAIIKFSQQPEVIAYVDAKFNPAHYVEQYNKFMNHEGRIPGDDQRFYKHYRIGLIKREWKRYVWEEL